MCLYAFGWLQSKLNALLDTTNPQKTSAVAGTALHRAYTSLLHSEANRWDERRQSRSKFLSHTWLIAIQALEGCCKLRKSPVSIQLEAHPSRTRGGTLLLSFHSPRQREHSWRDAATYRSHHHKDNPASWRKRPTRPKPPFARKQSPCSPYKASQHTLGRMAAQSRDRTYRNFSKYIIKQAACVWGGVSSPQIFTGRFLQRWRKTWSSSPRGKSSRFISRFLCLGMLDSPGHPLVGGAQATADGYRVWWWWGRFSVVSCLQRWKKKPHKWKLVCIKVML